MEATQKHVNRRSIAYLVAPALAALLGLGAHVALADTVTPSGAGFTASSSNVTFKVGGATVTCSSSANGTVPVPPNNPTSPGVAVCGNISTPAFTGCTGSISGIRFTASVTANNTNGPWQFCLSNSGPTGQLKIPAGGVKATATILGVNCTTNSTTAATVSDPWSNASSSVAFTNQTVNVSTSGGFPCPSATTATFGGTFTTNPHLTVGP
jgi:hypothetical protein